MSAGRYESRPTSSGRGPRIVITFSRTTPESVEEGDFSETGWIDEEGIDIWTLAKSRGETLPEAAADFLADEGIEHASSSQFHPGVWYSTDWEEDVSTGDAEEHSYHLKGFTPAQEHEIWKRMKRTNRWR